MNSLPKLASGLCCLRYISSADPADVERGYSVKCVLRRNWPIAWNYLAGCSNLLMSCLWRLSGLSWCTLCISADQSLVRYTYKHWTFLLGAVRPPAPPLPEIWEEVKSGDPRRGGARCCQPDRSQLPFTMFCFTWLICRSTPDTAPMAADATEKRRRRRSLSA